MIKVRVKLKKQIDNSYDILIGRGLFGKIAQSLKSGKIAGKYVIITDNSVEKLFGRKLLSQMSARGLAAALVSFKAGEKSKNLRTFSSLIEKVHALGLDRNSAVLALGGGVVGDVAGLVAAAYMRGIKCVQVPTTLLAQVDSSIGGKVAVDLSSGKNSCGAFHQPAKVYIDISLLKSLPEKELLNGLAEAVKHAVIRDSRLFSFIESSLGRILARDSAILAQLVERSCRIKAWIVENDENEKNLRKIVNYGHTIGHALETLTRYGRYRHGEAISIGMIAASRISVEMGWLGREGLERQMLLFRKAGLPVKLPKLGIGRIMKELCKDKKAVSGMPEFVLPGSIGRMKTVNGSYGIRVPLPVIRKSLAESQ